MVRAFQREHWTFQLIRALFDSVEEQDELQPFETHTVVLLMVLAAVGALLLAVARGWL